MGLLRYIRPNFICMSSKKLFPNYSTISYVNLDRFLCLEEVRVWKSLIKRQSLDCTPCKYLILAPEKVCYRQFFVSWLAAIRLKSACNWLVWCNCETLGGKRGSLFSYLQPDRTSGLEEKLILWNCLAKSLDQSKRSSTQIAKCCHHAESSHSLKIQINLNCRPQSPIKRRS